MTEDGKVYSKAVNKYLKMFNYRYFLRTEQGIKKTISLKTLYKITYNKVFCIDNIKSQEQEQWKEIEYTDGNYFVSNKGRIKSYCSYKAIILKPTITDKGYEKVQIIQNGKAYNKFIHCLVAIAFKEDCGQPQSNDWQVHHRNGKKNDNRSTNLLWVSPSQHYIIHNEIEKQ